MAKNRKRTSTGRTLSDDEIERIAEDVVRHDVDTAQLLTRRRGRPLTGSAPGEIVTVRMEPKLRKAVQELAASRNQSVSALVRDAMTQLVAADVDSSPRS